MKILRFFASAGAAFLVSALLYIITMSAVDSFREAGAFEFFAFMLAFYLLPFCYAGCLVGEVVYTFASKLANRLIGSLIFILTGALYFYFVDHFLLSSRNSFALYLCLSVLGSLSFYWAHFMNSKRLLLQLSLIPGYILVFSLLLIAA